MPEVTEDKKIEEPEANWNYTADATSSGEETDVSTFSTPNVEPVTWTASEFVAHEKDFTWFVFVGLAVMVVAAVVYFLDGSHSLVSPIIIIMAGVVFMMAAKKSPKVLTYEIDNTGVHVGQRLYSYSQFKSFSIIQEGGITSIILTPLKRFMPYITIYFEPTDMDKIADSLSVFLPHETKKQDPVDSFMRKIRF